MTRKAREPRPPVQGYSLEELINLMEKRGLFIEDRSKAVKTLENVGYYRFNDYAVGMMKNNQYSSGASFNKINNIYNFDCALRQIIFKALTNIEISFRARLVQYLSYNYGSLGYRNPEFFVDPKIHRNFLGNVDSDIKRNKEVDISGVIDEKQKDYPIWIVCEIFTFGDLTRLYANMIKKDRLMIAKQYNISEIYLETWLHHLSTVRNSCAHHGRIYGKLSVSRPLLNRSIKKIGAPEGSLFISFLIMNELSNDRKDWKLFVDSLEELITEYEKVIDIYNIGLPDNWLDFLRGHQH